MNRKGFAISTLIYGLSIMGILLMTILIAIMSVNRSNNRKLSNSIEEDLNRFSRTETTFSVTGKMAGGQEYMVPEGEAGWYKIELLGAAGNNGNGGYGAYTSGVIELEERDKLYFNIGETSSEGGGSTDVRIVSGNDKSSYSTRIMVAAGGGKNEYADGGTLFGYTNKMHSTGGRLNIVDNGKNYGLKSNTTLIGTPQDYSVEGAVKTSTGTNPNPSSSNGGGSGYFSSSSASSGGTSFIAGYAGCRGTNTAGELQEHPTVEITADQKNESTGEYIYAGGKRIYYFVDGLMIPGVNSKGDGSARIERVVKKTKDDQKLVRRNTELNKVSQITDCVRSGQPIATKISAISEEEGTKGQDVALGKGTLSGNCNVINLGGRYNLSEIAVWHDANGKDILNHRITVNNDKGTNRVLKTSSGISETETPTGYRVSAYQFDSSKSVPSKGNYYLIPVLSENMAVTAPVSSSDQSDIIVSYLTGLKRQKWSIELITNPKVKQKVTTPEYKIVELARFKALDITLGQNAARNALSATESFNELSRNIPQIWKINAVGDGTYTITTPVTAYDPKLTTGNIFAQMDSGENYYKKVIIGVNNNTTERFKLISVDYSGT